ncbi:MAG: type II toxin-antitoxin system HipA family toxin [Alphaproteobacteria bacterium]|nr:type II toxin-antitoxin system HipA family toxin [Alphaproteobacteria bacterium]MBU2083742.1 type II toxin-antitoxin system HipA family toxin [Alphaproteobacteria bacterium]MBU2143836.1 type II toxin-antitoxin system HipA family toxin [Alphaproteobacteria bacterium]MBU2197951.1 type II toxin-antitoxin system HipA family toxin [Alphaproteobacteria bacterium]
MTTRALTLWWGGRAVGTLSVDAHGEMGFAYLPAWLTRSDARAISVSLPLREEPYSRRECLPFFEGILPEESQRVNVAAALGVSERNEFRLLEMLGGEVAGALALWPEGEEPLAPEGRLTPKPMSDKELRALIDSLPKRPMLAGEEGLRLSLAGAQAKLPVILTSDGIALPVPGQPTTHILKPPITRFEGTTENEAYGMRLGRLIGLNVAEVDIHRAEGLPFLLVRRYDRVRSEEGTVTRLHQEDFCQALGFTSARKYASDGGPGFRDLFTLLRRVATRPAIEVLKLFDAAIFNLIIGNADAHGKNYSLLYDGSIELAPLYDLLSTVAYPELSPRLAMKIAKQAALEDIQARDWVRFAEETGLTEPYIRRRVKSLCGIVLEHAGNVAAGFDLETGERKAMSGVEGLVLGRAESLLGRV